jgi:hypothetical protein
VASSIRWRQALAGCGARRLLEGLGDREVHRRQRVECPRLFLHAAGLEVDSPSTGQRLTFSAPLPPELEEVLARLRAGAGPWSG